MAAKLTQHERILNLLKTGRSFTKAQLRKAVNGTDKSVLGRISDLRAEGYAVYSNVNARGTRSYRMGNPSRAMVALAHAVAGPRLFQ